MRRTVYSLLALVTLALSVLSFRASSVPAAAGEGTATTTVAAPATTAGPTPARSASASTSASSPAPGSASSPASSASASSATGLADGTYTGSAVSTRYGTVQVQIAVSGGVLTLADAVTAPSGDRHTEQISASAIPVLNREAVAAGSASIQMVSGATFTSTGYLTSLQSALDQAQG